MKRFLLIFLSILFVLLWTPTLTLAVDTCAELVEGRTRGESGVKEYVWDVSVDNDGNASCSGEPLAVSKGIFGWIVGFKITHTTSPSLTYDLELRDSNNFDWLYGELATAATSETDSSNIDVPLTDSGAYPYLHGEQLYPEITSSNTSPFQIQIRLRVKEK